MRREAEACEAGARDAADPPPRGPRRRAWSFARLAALVLSAAAGPELLASDAARPGSVEGGEPAPFVEACPLFRGGFENAGTFGFGEEALAGERPAWRIEPSQRFSLCPGAGASGVAGRSEARWSALPAWDPGEPLRGVRNATASQGRRLLRSSVILTGTAIASGAILSLLPKEETNWEDGAFDHGLSNFGRAWTNLPVWDRDKAYHNWFGHPYAGAFYYNMMRSQGATVGQSFAYCAFQSIVWEYVLEAAAEQPSIQDLVSTPIMGAAMGELFHRWSIAILRKGRLSFSEKALVFLLNPSYVINNGYRAPE